MKFHLRTKDQKIREKIDRLENWHKKFVWWPTRMTNDPTIVCWMEFVFRRGSYRWDDRLFPPWGAKLCWKWKYVESTFDILKGDV